MLAIATYIVYWYIRFVKQYNVFLNLNASNSYVKCTIFYYVVGPCSSQQICSSRCTEQQSQKINVTVPNSVIIPCGDLLSSPTSRVNYCNYTNGINELLARGVTAGYNLTATEPSHHNNIIYCSNDQRHECYMLNVFCKEQILLYAHSPSSKLANLLSLGNKILGATGIILLEANTWLIN